MAQLFELASAARDRRRRVQTTSAPHPPPRHTAHPAPAPDDVPESRRAWRTAPRRGAAPAAACRRWFIVVDGDRQIAPGHSWHCTPMSRWPPLELCVVAARAAPQTETQQLPAVWLALMRRACSASSPRWPGWQWKFFFFFFFSFSYVLCMYHGAYALDDHHHLGAIRPRRSTIYSRTGYRTTYCSRSCGPRQHAPSIAGADPPGGRRITFWSIVRHAEIQQADPRARRLLTATHDVVIDPRRPSAGGDARLDGPSDAHEAPISSSPRGWRTPRMIGRLEEPPHRPNARDASSTPPAAENSDCDSVRDIALRAADAAK